MSGKNFSFIELLDALRNGEPFFEINSGQAFDIGEDYKYKEIKYLKEKGIIKGDNKEYFKPKDFIAKEEVALIAYRIIKLLRKD